MANSESLQHLRKKISLLIDNELCNEECQSLLAKINSDPKCSKIFDNEKNFREYLKNNIHRPSCSSQLLEALKSKINRI